MLLSGVSDLRHLLKTLFEICKIKEKFKDKEIRVKAKPVLLVMIVGI